MAEYRIETDLIGEREVPAGALYGIHTVRAVENFPLSGRRVHPALLHAYGAVKYACAKTNHELGYIDDSGFAALEKACGELMDGLLDEHIIVDALQGGAGTSTNMNINEVLANRALSFLDRPPGSYDLISPSDTVNLHQSTNDTYPTAVKVACIGLLRELEREVVALLEAFQEQEKVMRDVVKVGRTEMQDAVLTTLGSEMASYASAFGRDRWRIYKCEERLREVNLGGTAIGTGLGAPRAYIFRVVEVLREITGYGLARAEYLVEATQNTDVFVEVSGILKAHASNLLKVASDLRFLSSGPAAGIGELHLPERQSGSSIMPGKVNPVIPEAVSQAALRAITNDQVITAAASMGNLELNAFLPVLADALLENLTLLKNAANILRRFCVEGMQADAGRCRKYIDNATSSLTALIETIGYRQATELAQKARRTGRTIREVVVGDGLVTEEEFDRYLSPEHVMRLGSPGKPPRGSGHE